jgi:enoyl-[acyl-carrier protein] reductase II
MRFSNRITTMFGVDTPIMQAPMGWIARSQLASAVSNAGGIGIIETSSGELDAVRQEIKKMNGLTTKPFGVNIALAFVRDPNIVTFVEDAVVKEGVKFVSTSAGDPSKFCKDFQSLGLKVFHVVPTLKAALKAAEAGVDGLIVEGAEGGGFKNPQPVMTMILLPLVREKTGLPLIAAGGITCGRTMAAAFAMGAEAVQMGTRMVSAAESPVHANWKNAIIDAEDTSTVFLNQFSKPALRALRTEKTARLERELVPGYQGPPVMSEFARLRDLYFGGDLEASIALTGQVAARIDSVKPVKQILDETVAEFFSTINGLSRQYPGQASS